MIIGLDAELFAVQGENEVLPAALALGTKHTRAIKRYGVFRQPQAEGETRLRMGSYYPDGAAVEFGVPEDESVEVLADRCGAVLEQIAAHLQESAPSTHMSLIPRGDIQQAHIDMLDESWGRDGSLQILGCNEDFNVYGLTVNRPDPKKTTWRTSGFHFHVAIPKELQSEHMTRELVSMLDVLVGVTCLFDTSAAARLRRAMYGRAGTYRTPMHGVEYRTLPSSVVLASRELFVSQATMVQQIASTLVDDITAADRLVGSFALRERFVMQTIEAETPMDIDTVARWYLDAASLFGVEKLAENILHELQTRDLHTITSWRA